MQSPVSQVRGILFDKDGTLIDFNQTWLPAYQEATRHIAASCRQPSLADELLTKGGYLPQTRTWQADSLLASGSNRQILATWEQLAGVRFTDKLLADIDAIFDHYATLPVAAVPNLKSLLQQLSQTLVLGVATMDDERQAVATLEALDIGEYFTFVCGADSGFGEKPQPGMVTAFAAHTGLETTQVVVVGDSPRDITMAHQAKALAGVGVLTGASSAEDLARLTPHVFDSIQQLPRWLAGKI